MENLPVTFCVTLHPTLCLFHPDCVQWLKSTALLMLFLSTSTPRVKKQDTETLACNFPKCHRFSQFFTDRLTGKFATLIFKHPTKSLASFFLQYRPLQNKLNFCHVVYLTDLQLFFLYNSLVQESNIS